MDHLDSQPRVLIVGLDPDRLPGIDPDPIRAGLAYGLSRFAGSGLQATDCLVAADESAEIEIVSALSATDYACVVVGGGIRKPEALLPFFEAVVNLIHTMSPRSRIAFNSDGGDSLDAARRVLGL